MLQVMYLYFSCPHKKELLSIKMKESYFPYDNLQFLLGFSAISMLMLMCDNITLRGGAP